MPVFICITHYAIILLNSISLGFCVEKEYVVTIWDFIWVKTKYIFIILLFRTTLRIFDSYIWCCSFNIFFKCLVIFINTPKCTNLISIVECDLIPIFTLSFYWRIVYILCPSPSTYTAMGLLKKSYLYLYSYYVLDSSGRSPVTLESVILFCSCTVECIFGSMN